MADADTNDNTSQNSSDASQGTKGAENNALNAQLTEVQEQLRRMNAQMEATQNALAESNRKKVAVEDDENIYDPKVTLKKAEAMFERKYADERKKDIMIHQLAQEYPELRTDSKLQQAVGEAQRQVSEAIRDTAEGYEMAVLKAVAKVGLVAKSRRSAIDEDASISPRSSGPRPPVKRNKVSERTLQVAEMLGRDISDPKVLAGLEEAANRDTYSKYR